LTTKVNVFFANKSAIVFFSNFASNALSLAFFGVHTTYFVS
jgi:hypothetical protein